MEDLDDLTNQNCKEKKTTKTVVHMAYKVGNQSERSKDNRRIVFEGHVTH